LIATVTDVTVVCIGPPNQSPTAILKLAQTQHASMNLRRQKEVLADLHGDGRLGEWRALLPTVLAANEIDGQAYMVEQMLPGQEARRTLAGPETRVRMQCAASVTISELHLRTATSVVVDSTMLERWINQPIRVMRQSRSVLACAAGTDQAIARLVTELHQAFMGRTVMVSRVHGDFAPNNIFVTPDGSTVTGIIDWDQGAPDGLPLLDLLMLLLSTQMVVERREMGDVVQARLNGLGWTPHEQALIETARTALPGDVIELRPMVLLCWLRHVNANLTTATLDSGRLWARRNIEAVLRCL
jgi:aminoglycoside phosphotransferase (APT) family kinase protein